MPVTKRPGFEIGDALGLFMRGAAQVFSGCELGDCNKHSLGIVCTMCSRRICQRHAYVTASVPPKPICVSCIMEEHRELWDENDPHYQPDEPPRREREQRRDPPREEPRRQAKRDDGGPVIDVEYESMGGGGGRRR